VAWLHLLLPPWCGGSRTIRVCWKPWGIWSPIGLLHPRPEGESSFEDDFQAVVTSRRSKDLAKFCDYLVIIKVVLHESELESVGARYMVLKDSKRAKRGRAKHLARTPVLRSPKLHDECSVIVADDDSRVGAFSVLAASCWRVTASQFSDPAYISSAMTKVLVVFVGMQPVMYSMVEAMLGRPCWRRAGRETCYYRNHFLRHSTSAGATKSRTYFTLTFTVTFQHEEDVCYLAYHYPYTYTKLKVSSHRDVLNEKVEKQQTWKSLCKSVVSKLFGCWPNTWSYQHPRAGLFCVLKKKQDTLPVPKHSFVVKSIHRLIWHC